MKVTLLETFHGKGLILAPKIRMEFDTFDEAETYVRKEGLDINLKHRFGLATQRANGGK